MQSPNLLTRVKYSIAMGWRYRKNVGAYLFDKNLQLNTITDLSLARLQKSQIQVLILDFDGVLGPDNALAPIDQVKPWLDQIYQYYQDRLFVLSNKPLPFREMYLEKHYPELQFIKNVAKKPYPDGLLLIKHKVGVMSAHILFCDDRLLTGILAAELADVKALWIKKPYRNFIKRFWQELFFTYLRFFERTFLKLFGR